MYMHECANKWGISNCQVSRLSRQIHGGSPNPSRNHHPGAPHQPQGPRAMNGLTLGAPLFAGSGPWLILVELVGCSRLWDDSTDWLVTLVGQLQFNMVSKITRDLRPPRSHGKHWKPAPHPLDLDIQTHGAGHEFGQDIPATIEIRTWFLYVSVT